MTIDAVGRKQFLLSRKCDIEFEFGIIAQRLTTLSAISSRIAVQYTNQVGATQNPTVLASGLPLPTDDPAFTGTPTAVVGSGGVAPGGAGMLYDGIDFGTMSYEAATAQIAALDKQLELRQNDLQAQQKECQTEIESAQKIIDATIKQAFTYGAQG